MQTVKSKLDFVGSITVISIAMLLTVGSALLLSGETKIAIRGAIITCFVGSGALIYCLVKLEPTTYDIRDRNGNRLYFRDDKLPRKTTFKTKEEAQAYINSGQIDTDLNEQKAYFI